MRTVLARRAAAILYQLAGSAPPGVFLLPANVCPVVPLALIAAGRRFAFVDVDPETLGMRVEVLRERLATGVPEPVSAAVFVRTYGRMEDATDLFAEMRRLARGLVIIDDRCAARPELSAASALRQGADVVLYSTGYAKHTDLGWGGFAHLQDTVDWRPPSGDYREQHLKDLTCLWKRHIEASRPLFLGDRVPPGLLDRFPLWLDLRPPEARWTEYADVVQREERAATAHKQAVNAIYARGLPRVAQLPAAFHSWRFQLRCPGKRQLLARIFAAGLFASGHYYPAAHLFGGRRMPGAGQLHEEVVNLFNDGRISLQDARRLAGIVREHLETCAADSVGERQRCDSSS